MLNAQFVSALAAALTACAAPVAPSVDDGPDFQGLSGLDAGKAALDSTLDAQDATSDAALVETVASDDAVGGSESDSDLSAEFIQVMADSTVATDAAADVEAHDDLMPDDLTPDIEAEGDVAQALEATAGDAIAADLTEASAAEADEPPSEVSAVDAKPGDAAGDAWSAPAGGQPGSGCFGQDGTVTCSPDGKYRVECNNGAWTALQHCGFGVCTAKLSSGGAVATTCGVPAAKHGAANDACARYSNCFGGPGHETCVRGVLASSAYVAGLPVGKAVGVADLAFTGIAGNLACAAAATSCPALAECLYFFAQPKCQAASAGCAGDVAWQCASGAALAVHCKGLGMACVAGGGTAQCIASEPCAANAPVLCKDGMASKCATLADGKPWTEKVDCAAVAGGCQQGAASIAAACSGPPETPCSAKEFVAGCKDGFALTCVNGDTIHAPCGPGLTCAVENQFALFEKACPEGQSCAVALCTEGGSCSAKAKCNGSEVWFCEAKQPAAYDCKAKGMTCSMGPGGPRCQ